MKIYDTSFTNLYSFIVVMAFMAGALLPPQESSAAGLRESLFTGTNESLFGPFSLGTGVNYVEVIDIAPQNLSLSNRWTLKDGRGNYQSTCVCAWDTECWHSNRTTPQVDQVMNILGTARKHTATMAWKRWAPIRPVSFLFIRYGDIERGAEKARLNGFARQLQAKPSATGTIIAYGGRSSTADVAEERANRAKEYLVTSRGIDPSRLTTVDAGYKEEPSTELWIVPQGAAAPAGSPTVDP